jgi:hypothetical protein
MIQSWVLLRLPLPGLLVLSLGLPLELLNLQQQLLLVLWLGLLEDVVSLGLPEDVQLLIPSWHCLGLLLEDVHHLEDELGLPLLLLWGLLVLSLGLPLEVEQLVQLQLSFVLSLGLPLELELQLLLVL